MKMYSFIYSAQNRSQGQHDEEIFINRSAAFQTNGPLMKDARDYANLDG